jgi:signal transduction histidine kinase
VLAAALATLPLLALIGYSSFDRYDADRARGESRAIIRAELYATLLADAPPGTSVQDALTQSLRISPLLSGSAAEVLSEDGETIASAGGARALLEQNDTRVQAALDTHSTFDARGTDGVHRVWGLARVPGTGMTVAFGFPGSFVYGAAETAIKRDLVVAAIVAGVALTSAFLLAGRVTAPIRRLAVQVGEGPEDVRDDIGAIERGVNRMGEAIEENEVELARRAARLEQVLEERNRAYEEVQVLNEELEDRVALRTKQLEDANRELDAFSYSVSHDLRAPLRAIDGFSRIVIEDYAGQLPPEGLRYLRIVEKNTRDMGVLIDGLLSFSRLGHQHLDKRTVDVEELAREVVAASEAGTGDDEPQIAIGRLPRAEADRTLLRQVYVNLVSNAVKYTRGRDGAHIELGSYADPATNGDGEGTAVYFVRDNGVGFDMRHADKLFQVFQRLHSDGYEGTGLGLALVERIVKRHGGDIWAEGKPDEGAAFYFTLEGGPREREDSRDPARRRQPA